MSSKNVDDKDLLMSSDKLYDLTQIDQALTAMALEINEYFIDKNPLVIGVMNGAIVTLGHLLPKLTILLEVDYCHATRYGANTIGGDVHWISHPQKQLQDRYILLVDDIFDEGVTLKHIAEYCITQGAVEVKSAVLLNKKHKRKVEGFTVDFSSITVEDRYVFGFGLDYNGLYRNAAGIFAVSETPS